MNRFLFLTHRWVGIALALFMFIWFTSGLVIMYSGPSALTPSQQLQHREDLSPADGWLSVGAALAGVDNNSAADVVSARLVRLAGHPSWLIENTKGQRFALSAIDGGVHEVSVADAEKIALTWVSHSDAAVSNSPGVAVTYRDTGPQDSSVRNYDNLRPFHKFSVADSSRELLISARTGEVIRDSTTFSRALYWTGNWIHLLRGIEVFASPEARRNTLLYLGLFAVIASLTGLIVGWQRWRPGWFGKKTYGQGRVHPYREKWTVWHFWVGLIGGIAALLWAFSGYISTNPLQLFSEANANNIEQGNYQGKSAPDTMINWQPTSAIHNDTGNDIVELSWRYVGDQATLVAVTRAGERIAQTASGTASYFSDGVLLEASSRLTKTPVAEHSLLTEYDSYYYPRHYQTNYDRPLPVVRVDLADEAGTRLYLDPQDGRILLKADTSRRVYRWLYSALHHWDFGWFHYRPLWDLWMLPLVLMGIVLGSSSVVLGWRRLKLEFKPKKKRKTAPIHVAGVDKPTA